jgi:hypothetical protein
MNKAGKELSLKLADSLPAARLVWETEPADEAPGLDGSVLTADLHGKKLTIRFESMAGRSADAAELESRRQSLIASLEEIVEDFLSFFTRSIYRKEKFTRTVDC